MAYFGHNHNKEINEAVNEACNKALNNLLKNKLIVKLISLNDEDSDGLTVVNLKDAEPAKITFDAQSFDLSGKTDSDSLIINTKTISFDTDAFENAAAATPEEVAAWISEAEPEGFYAGVKEGKLFIESTLSGVAAKLTVGAGTLNTAFGLTDNAVFVGVDGLGLSQDPAGEYAVFVSPFGKEAEDVPVVSVYETTPSTITLSCDPEETELDVYLCVLFL